MNLPPHNKEAEQSLLAVLIGSPEKMVDVVSYIEPPDFYFRSHELIYKALADLWDQTTKIDMITLVDRLEFNGDFESIGEHAGIIQATDIPHASAEYIRKYAKIVKEKSIRRKMIYAANQLNTRAFDEEEALENTFGLHDMRMSQIEAEFTRSFKEEGMAFDKALEEVLNRRAPSGRGLTTGIDMLDKYTIGLKKSHLWMIYATPSTGKTFFGIHIAHHLLKEGKSVRFLSLEMAAEEIWDRLIRFEQEGDEQELGAYDRAKEWNFVVEDGLFTMSSIKRYIKQNTANTDLFVIDYLGLIENEQKLGEIENIITSSRELQKTAKKNDACLLTLAQANTAEDESIFNINIKGGSSVRAVGDVIIKLKREVNENHVAAESRDSLHVILQKNKFGIGYKQRAFDINPLTGGMNL